MKYRYHKQYVREDYLLTKSPIFDLQKYHKLKNKGDLLPNRKRFAKSKEAGLNSESFSNMLGF